MRYLLPARPLAALRPSTREPGAGAVLEPDGTSIVETRGGPLAVHGATGAWALLDPGELEILTALGGRTAEGAAAATGRSPEAVGRFARELWARGLVSAAGIRSLDADRIDEEIRAIGRRTFVLVLSLASGCNLACRYCYWGQATPHPVERMDASLAEAILVRAIDRAVDRVVVDFGEVAAAEDLFRRLARFARDRATRTGRELHLLVQTNGTRLAPEFVRFLAEQGVQAGVSLDGPARLNDRARVFRNGRGAHSPAVEGVRRLVGEGVGTWLVATIGRHNVAEPEGVVGELLELGASDHVFKPVLPLGDAGGSWRELGIEVDEFRAFLARAVRFALGRSLDDLDLSRRNLLFRALGDARGWANPCISRRCGCGTGRVVVESNGSRSPCPRFPGVRPAGDGPSLEVEVPPAIFALPGECERCPWLGACGGGCPLGAAGGAAWSSAGTALDPHCGSYRTSFEVLFDEVVPRLVAGVASGSIGPCALVSR